MNDKGEIRHFNSDEEAEAAGFKKISHKEAEQLEAVPESSRQIELLWIRFWQVQRKFRKANEEKGMRHAFITGFRIANELRKEK